MSNEKAEYKVDGTTPLPAVDLWDFRQHEQAEKLIAELRALNARLRTRNAELEYTLEQCAPNHPLVVAPKGGDE